MAEVASNGPTPVADPSEPVPLDTIPISPNGKMTEDTNGADHGLDNEKIITVFEDPANFNVNCSVTQVGDDSYSTIQIPNSAQTRHLSPLPPSHEYPSTTAQSAVWGESFV